MSSHWLLFCIVCREKSAVTLLAFPHTWWVMFLLFLLRFSHFLSLSAFYYIFRYGSICFYSVWGSSCFWKYRSMLFFKFQAFSHYFFLYFSFPFFPSFFLLVFLLYIFWYSTFLSGFIHFYSFYPHHISYSIDLSSVLRSFLLPTQIYYWVFQVSFSFYLLYSTVLEFLLVK